jgi:hypothetical protein
VDALLMAVLESGTEPLLVHLVEHCKLLTALASAPQAIKPRGGKHEVRSPSHKDQPYALGVELPRRLVLLGVGGAGLSSVRVARAGAPEGGWKPQLTLSEWLQVRCGNLGHISRLGNKIVELAASGEGAIAEMCAGHEGWLDWVDAGLSERNAVENLTSWQVPSLRHLVAALCMRRWLRRMLSARRRRRSSCRA